MRCSIGEWVVEEAGEPVDAGVEALRAGRQVFKEFFFPFHKIK